MIPNELLTAILFKIYFPVTRNQLLNNILLGKLYKINIILSKDYLKLTYKNKIQKISIYESKYVDIMSNLHKNIRYLDLSCIQLTNKGLKELSNNLKLIPKLTDLCLYNNIITDEGIIELSQYLKYIPKLTILNLSYNYISNKGIIE
ncbi:MAG: hypothetical protein KIT69_20535, partial [Propionibacteriaceae bacterium]|nr:hypothetical protein [Propionibacteriaceae bacterium]